MNLPLQRPTRTAGQIQPGIPWGPFTLRVPFYHTRTQWPELWQGMLVASATGLALVPILMTDFGLEFEQAVACVFIQAVLLSSTPILFGEPFAPGWITPALPLALSFVAAQHHGVDVYATPTEKFQIMTAVSLDFALLVFLLGITGLGRRLIGWLPAALKGGIILGASIAALKRVFLDDAHRFLYQQPVATTLAISFCLILTFSLPLQHYKLRFRSLAILASLGLLPGFLIAALVGPLVAAPNLTAAGEATREIVFQLEWGWIVPPFLETFQKVSPFWIGWPDWKMFVDGVPLALMGYVIVFGDLITGIEVLRAAESDRPDEKIDINLNRSHFSMCIRNLLMGLFAPFFPTQGCLWTGVHVIVVQSWREGRQVMDSLFGGIASYYVFGIPLLYLVKPLVTGLKPMMGIALSLTLVLTGFACAYVAMGIPRTQIERGVAVLTAVALAIFSPWIGMAIGIAAVLLLVGIRSPDGSC
jgi:hypothetical protein